MLALDICSGTGSATAAMRDKGWQVVTVELDPTREADYTADVRAWSWTGKQPDLIWCSPPCTEFARESMPWSKTGNTPDMSIVEACIRIIQEARPRYWLIENVRGAVPYFRPLLGEPREIHGPFYLWGHFPALGRPRLNHRKKESYGSHQAHLRGMIPYPLSLALATAIEQQGELLHV